jgi:rhamnose utilization protein RhaD (predicted bifunctional aldolase and dehydrogenase)/NAD(P)-dependent dehydrogenase (short-subunit alcohol dehydrogenase family)
MQSAWNDQEAAVFVSEGHGNDLLQQRVYTSRLLGREPSLVLHGGGNTSVKATLRNILGEEENILHIKGSGWDLVTIGAAGFAPTRLTTLQRLAELPALSDSDMMRELKAACTNPAAPTPSVEAILHAIIPSRFVDHTHADAVVAISNTPNGEKILHDMYGDDVLILPYVMPGFILAQQIFEATRTINWEKLKGIILLHHGVFTFHENAKNSYENMIALVDTAEQYLREKNIWSCARSAEYQPASADFLQVATMRKQVSNLAGKPMLARWDASPAAVGYSALDNIASIATRGPLTPDHTLHTKRTAMVVDNESNAVELFAQHYRSYFDKHNNGQLTCLDAAPRVGVWKNRGMLYFAPTEKRVKVVQDIASHTQRAVQWAEKMGGWQALPEQDIFELEYWELEQAKLKSSAILPALEGKIAIVTGAASGIGRACVELLVKRGACVAALDINPAITQQFSTAQVSGMVCDVTDSVQLRSAVQKTVQQFGGADIVISNAGFFPNSASLENLTGDVLEKSLQLNFTSHFALLRECIAFLRVGCEPAVVMVASKNVPAPGPGAMAYSSAKAALTQMARVAALELGEHGIRVNAVHPNAVFDTGIWDEKTLQARAAAYGLTVEKYKTSNVLQKEVTSMRVAATIVALCGEDFSCTTGAQIAVDGGNDRVI